MEQEKITDIISSSSDALTTVDGIITSIYKSHMRKYERADSYLETVILEKGFASDKDVETAARLYGIPMLHKKYRNIAKTLNKADALCKKRIQETKEKVTDVDNDWLTYFMERVSIVSEESIQSIFACILTQECCESGSMRKVMIDRLALLDRKSARLFSILCQLTYSVEVNDGRIYYVPLYLRDNILVELVKNKATLFAEDQAIEYQNILAEGLDSDCQLEDLESELDMLQEIGLNLSREKSADAQILMRNYMMERFLERISLSEYRDKFILKGGMLVAAMVGLDARSTMDLDATIKGANVNVEDIENLISSIVTVPIDDGVKFQLKSISEIMDEAEYPGIRVSMSTTFDGVVTPLKIDISTGDAITPREVRYSFKLMLEDRSIDIWAYNLETVLAEKLETIITRTTTNTRMRDFYDIYILEQLHGTTLNPKILHDALLATAHKRGSEKYLNQAEEVFDEVENDSVMQKLWEAYRKKFSYASDLEWDVIMKAIRRLYVLCEKGISL